MRKLNTMLLHLPTLLLIPPSLSLPQQQTFTTIPNAPLPWITINPSGSAQTHSPKVITTEGHLTTISQPPSFLLSTATYTLSPDGTNPSTYIGLPPIASATGEAGTGGAFLACSNTVGLDEPFCLPKRGSTLYPGNTYYITWAPAYFPSSPYLTLHITLNSLSSGSVSGTTGQIISSSLPSSSGYYPLPIPSDFLTNLNTTSASITLSLSYSDESTPNEPNDIITIPGPTVFISSPLPKEKESSKGINIIAIAVPLIIVLLLLALLGFCFIKWRKTGQIPFVGAVVKRTRRASTGYGIGKSKSQRIGNAGVTAAPGDRGPYNTAGGRGLDKETAVEGGVELTDRDSWGSPTSPKGRNVFREEVERQEREAGKK
ncbi:hypothetical protein QBC38DRAFT_490795 [Podospora fimiseda]|uniref:Uncharacterized protein n=1 Tax=Podospora fimiseda TaxID=252190 RepID=A0AAN7BFG7_9PEZI|nr:hypothetical protein QBC38DRAFT_490795 [Podospora fimiseda]